MPMSSGGKRAAIRAIAIAVAAFLEQVLATVMERFLDWTRARCNRGDYLRLTQPSRTGRPADHSRCRAALFLEFRRPLLQSCKPPIPRPGLQTSAQVFLSLNTQFRCSEAIAQNAQRRNRKMPRIGSLAEQAVRPRRANGGDLFTVKMHVVVPVDSSLKSSPLYSML